MRLLGLIVACAIGGGAAVIVFPYVAVDFLRSSERQMRSAEWAAWVQAVGSILTVGSAAFIAVFQQEKSRQLQEEQRRRRNLAARALLPAAFSELIDYTNKCLDALHAYRERMLESGETPSFKVPRTRTSTINSIKDCIETADDGPGTRLAELLEKLQIQNSRLSLIGLESPRVNIITTRFNN